MPNLMPGLPGLLGVFLALPEVTMLFCGATAPSGELVSLGERFGSLVGVVVLLLVELCSSAMLRAVMMDIMSRAMVARIARYSTDVPNCPDSFQFPQVH